MRPLNELFLGIDLGTSGVKAAAIDGSDRVVAQATAPLGLQRPQPGWSEQSPEDWWQATLAADRWVGIHWPTEYGGRGATPLQVAIFNMEYARSRAPQPVNRTGVNLAGPTLLAHGTEQQKHRWLPGILTAEEIWCQLFSEPNAGSDLAGLSTTAMPVEGGFVVQGQKVWTSYAQFSRWGIALVRTDPDAPKHRGLTGFVLDMRAPGVDVRPLRQMTGGASFNEVYFDEVRVADDQRLGDVNAGWGVALTTLMNERAAIGGGSGRSGQGLFGPKRARAMLDHFDLLDDPVVRDRYVRLYCNTTVAKWNGRRALDKLRAGQMPGPEMSTAKLALTQNMLEFCDFISLVLGPRLVADSGEWGTYAFSKFVLGSPGMRIAGGTDEVMRNIVAERVLGLPKDPGVDAKTAFRDLPR